MAFRLDLDEDLRTDLIRVLEEQLDRAQRALEGSDKAAGVHEARKRFKSLRGALRLLRPALDDVYERENARFRDAARTLASARDAAALLETLTALDARFGAVLDPSVIGGLRTWLQHRLQREEGGARDFDRLVALALDEIEQAHESLEDWPLPQGFKPLQEGLKKIYAKNRDAMREAAAGDDPEILHEWRKVAKHHWMHVRLLRNLDPDALKPRSEALRDLTQTLGDANDLALLVETLNDADCPLDASARKAFAHLCDARRKELRADAIAQGAALFEESPKAFAERMKDLWSERH